MRKLTVKNFSVIKDAELEFGKITVLIGPQSSGKSLLCKLAYFFGKELVDLAMNSILVGTPWEQYVSIVSEVFRSRFDADGTTFSANNLIQFESGRYEVWAKLTSNPSQPELRFGVEFEAEYKALTEAPDPDRSMSFYPANPSGPSLFRQREQVWHGINRIISETEPDGAFYIPAGRAFFTNTAKSLAIVSNPGLDKITRDFSAQLLWEQHWKIGLLTTGRGITDGLARMMSGIARGFVMRVSGSPIFLREDGRKIQLEMLSSGTQEILPLFEIIEQTMYFREHSVERDKPIRLSNGEIQYLTAKPLMYLEEPEANVFPDTQYQLVRLFAWLSTDPVLAFSWVITTHSPYILSSFNNLLEAWQVAAAKPDAKDEVAKLIEERYWIRPSDFKAYCIHDGKLESIMDEETGLINGNYLDGVSNEIGSQFDELLRIGYVEA